MDISSFEHSIFVISRKDSIVQLMSNLIGFGDQALIDIFQLTLPFHDLNQLLTNFVLRTWCQFTVDLERRKIHRSNDWPSSGFLLGAEHRVYSATLAVDRSCRLVSLSSPRISLDIESFDCRSVDRVRSIRSSTIEWHVEAFSCREHSSWD